MNTPSRIARRPLLITAIAAGLLLIGLSTWVMWPTGPKGLSELAGKDPHGAKACEVLAEWLTGDIKGSKDDLRAHAGPDAYAATTAGIRATAVNVSEGTVLAGMPMYLTRVESLYTACETAGVDMPPKDGKL